MAFSATNSTRAISSYGALTNSSVDRMRAAGIPDDVIGAADSILTGDTSTLNSSSGSYNTQNSASTGPQAYGIDPNAVDLNIDSVSNIGLVPGTQVPGSQTTYNSTPVIPDPKIPILDDPGRIIDNVGNIAVGEPAIDNGSLDKQYNALTPRHVVIFRALGIPESTLAALNGKNPNAGEVEAQLEEIIKNPAALDAQLGRQQGTTAQLLSQIPKETLANPAGAPSPSIPMGPQPVDSWDSQYKNLTVSHVQLLRGVGTPENKIAEIDSMRPNATEMETYLTEQVVAHPEWWDSQVGNPAGTARKFLSQFPDFGVSATPQTDANGNIIPDTGVIAPKTGGSNDWIKTAVIAAAVIGGGFLLLKAFKGRSKLEPMAEAVMIQNGIMQPGQKATKELVKMAEQLGLQQAKGGMFGNRVASGILGGAQWGNNPLLQQNLMGQQLLQRQLMGGVGLGGGLSSAVQSVPAPILQTTVDIKSGFADAAFGKLYSAQTMLDATQQMAAAQAPYLAQIAQQGITAQQLQAGIMGNQGAQGVANLLQTLGLGGQSPILQNAGIGPLLTGGYNPLLAGGVNPLLAGGANPLATLAQTLAAGGRLVV